MNNSSDSTFPKSDWIIFAALAVALFPLAVVTYNHLGEDAFITFRYVRNLVAGRGLTFNAGEHVEGYSNLLWVILLTPFEAAGIRQHVAARWLSVTFLALLVLGAGWAVRRICAERAPGWLRWWLPAALFLEPLLHYHIDRGLETVSFAALLGMMVLAAGAGFTPWVAGGLGALAAISRPEGIGFVFAVVPVFFLVQLRNEGTWSDGAKAAAKFLALPVAFFAGQMILRVVTYVEFVPNTVIAKSEGSPGGLREIAALFFSHALVPLIGLAGCVAGFRRAETMPLALAAGLQWLAAIAFQLFAGGLLNIGFRYLVPVLIPSVIGVWLLVYVISMTWIESETGERARHLPLVVAIPLLLLVPVLIFRPGSRVFTGNEDAPRSRFHVRLFEKESWQFSERWQWFQRDPIFLNAEAGRWLRENLPAKATLALDQMGQTGFYAGPEQTIIDLLGLMDNHIARHGRSVDYLNRRGVNYVVIESLANDTYWPRDWRLLPHVGSLRSFAATPEFQAQFAPRWILTPRFEMKIVYVVWERRSASVPPPEIVEIGVTQDEFEKWWRVR